MRTDEPDALPLALFPFVELPTAVGEVTAIASEGEAVCVGTSTGSLLRFSDAESFSEPMAQIELCSAKEKHAVRPVRAVQVLADHRVVVVLCNGLATVHAIDSLAKLCTLNTDKTKAEAMCVNREERLPRVMLSAAAQRSLLFYRLSVRPPRRRLKHTPPLELLPAASASRPSAYAARDALDRIRCSCTRRCRWRRRRGSRAWRGRGAGSASSPTLGCRRAASARTAVEGRRMP